MLLLVLLHSYLWLTVEKNGQSNSYQIEETTVNSYWDESPRLLPGKMEVLETLTIILIITRSFIKLFMILKIFFQAPMDQKLAHQIQAKKALLQRIR